jgi:hypothetical protein
MSKCMIKDCPNEAGDAYIVVNVHGHRLVVSICDDHHRLVSGDALREFSFAKPLRNKG